MSPRNGATQPRTGPEVGQWTLKNWVTKWTSGCTEIYGQKYCTLGATKAPHSQTVPHTTKSTRWDAKYNRNSTLASNHKIFQDEICS